MPTVVRLESAGHRIALVVPGRNPAEPSPRQRAAEEKRRVARRREKARAAATEAANARGFARHLVATHDVEPAAAAIAEAAAARPIDPKSWIAASLRYDPENGFCRRPTRVLPFVKPSGTRETQFIGWSSREPRMKLYRRPESRVKEVAPDHRERVPTLAEDAGCTVA